MKVRKHAGVALAVVTLFAQGSFGGAARAKEANTATRWTVSCTSDAESGGFTMLISPSAVLFADDSDPNWLNLTNVSIKQGASSLRAAFSVAGYDFQGSIVRNSKGRLVMNSKGSPQAACIRYSNGMEQHRVVNVADDDQLQVRALPRATARSVGSIKNDYPIMVDPTQRNGSWIRADIQSETAPGQIIKGWVNAKFVSPDLDL